MRIEIGIRLVILSALMTGLLTACGLVLSFVNSPGLTTDSSVLFMDGYTKPNSTWDEFSDADGGMEFTDGDFRFVVNAADIYYMSTIYRHYEDVNINVDNKKIGGPDYNNIGVMGRFKEDSNYYQFSISSDGYYAIFKQIDGEWTMLVSNEWNYNDQVIETGDRINYIRVTYSGTMLRMEVNGTTMMEVVDSDLAGGDVGLYAGTYEKPGVEVVFDNFVVTKP